VKKDNIKNATLQLALAILQICNAGNFVMSAYIIKRKESFCTKVEAHKVGTEKAKYVMQWQISKCDTDPKSGFFLYYFSRKKL
jgi:hypothetical protein